MNLKNELMTYCQEARDIEKKIQEEKVRLYWDVYKDKFIEYLKKASRLGRTYVELKYVSNQLEPISTYMPIEITLKLNPEDAWLISDYIVDELKLNVKTKRDPKLFQVVSWL